MSNLANSLTGLAMIFFAADVYHNYPKWKELGIKDPTKYDKVSDKKIKLLSVEKIGNNKYEFEFSENYYNVHDNVALEGFDGKIFLDSAVDKSKFEGLVVGGAELPKLKLPTRTLYVANYAPDTFEHLVKGYKEFLKLSDEEQTKFLEDLRKTFEDEFN